MNTSEGKWFRTPHNWEWFRLELDATFHGHRCSQCDKAMPCHIERGRCVPVIEVICRECIQSA